MRSRSAVSLSRGVALVASTSLLLAACSGEDAPSEEATASPSPTSTVSVPGGETLTEPGSELKFGDTATVIFEPDQRSGTVLQITVKKAAKGSLKDFSAFILDEYTKKATPYYVAVSVKNVGEGTVGGVPVPVWGVDTANTLLPAATFTTSFSRCASDRIPKTFKAGDSLNTCLVYLAPNKGTMEAVSFRPNQAFDPIEWTGDIATPEPKAKSSKKR